MKICFATNNSKKIEEIKKLLDVGFEILSLQDIGCNEELPEDQQTIEGNSLQKAEYVFQHFKVACFADDTGLEVEALGGEPGVYSARYAGPLKKDSDNIELLLLNLKDKSNRKARFKTVITLIENNGNVVQFEGVVRGEIIDQRKGLGGFGYDPIFVPEGFNSTFAEISLDEKNKISHRGKAIQKLVDYLRKY
jgi:XTP/dITP diphosphohydrolase